MKKNLTEKLLNKLLNWKLNTDIRVAQIASESTATAQRIKQLNLQFTKDGVQLIDLIQNIRET